jgi:U4/U6 small nuclear ribonucleoprotein PRP31
VILTQPTINTNWTEKETKEMATLADELLNDFEDSGSEGDGNESHDFMQHGDAETANSLNPATKNLNPDGGSMELDGDEDDVGDADEDLLMGDGSNALSDADDEEEAKAKVEKMQLGHVDDVRNIAGLMTTLDPVLEVNETFFFSLPTLFELKVYIYERGTQP